MLNILKRILSEKSESNLKRKERCYVQICGVEIKRYFELEALLRFSLPRILWASEGVL